MVECGGVGGSSVEVRLRRKKTMGKGERSRRMGVTYHVRSSPGGWGQGEGLESWVSYINTRSSVQWKAESK